MDGPQPPPPASRLRLRFRFPLPASRFPLPASRFPLPACRLPPAAHGDHSRLLRRMARVWQGPRAMAEIFNDTLAAGATSASLTVSPLAPLAFNASAPCEVLAKNSASSGESWGLLYRCSSTDDTRILYPTSGTIRVKAGSTAARILIIDG